MYKIEAPIPQEEIERLKARNELLDNSKIVVDIDDLEEPFSPEKQKLIQETIEFLKEVSDEFEQEFRRLLDECRLEDKFGQQTREVGERIKEYMEEKDWYKPEFTITTGISTAEELNNLGFEDQIEGISADSIVVNFQLPKPLAHFWRKGKGTWGSGGKDMAGKTIPWGIFYRHLVQKIIWKKKEEQNEEGHLELRKINENMQHDPEKYYYLFEVSHYELDEYLPKDTIAKLRTPVNCESWEGEEPEEAISFLGEESLKKLLQRALEDD